MNSVSEEVNFVSIVEDPFRSKQFPTKRGEFFFQRYLKLQRKRIMSEKLILKSAEQVKFEPETYKEGNSVLQIFKWFQKYLPWERVNDMLGVFKFSRLRSLCIGCCRVISTLQFLSYIQAPNQKRIDVRDIYMIASMRPLNKIFPKGIKYDQILYQVFGVGGDFSSDLGEISRVKLHPNMGSVSSTLSVWKNSKHRLELITTELKVFVESEMKLNDVRAQIKGILLTVFIYAQSNFRGLESQISDEQLENSLDLRLVRKWKQFLKPRILQTGIQYKS